MLVGIAAESMITCAGPDFFPSIFTNVGAICVWIENKLRHFQENFIIGGYVYCICIYIYVCISLDIYAAKSMTTCAEPDFFPSIFTNVGSICVWIENQLQHFQENFIIGGYMYCICIYIYVCVSLDIYATKSMKTCAGPDFFPSIITNVGAICVWIENQLRHFQESFIIGGYVYCVLCIVYIPGSPQTFACVGLPNLFPCPKS